MVTPLCPLCMGVSHINSLMAQTLWQNQTLHGYGAYNWSCGDFVIYLLILAKNWLPWQRPLDRCNQKYLLWIAWPRKTPAISNNILTISRTNAFYAFIAILVPKLVAMVTPLWPVSTGVSQMNSLIAQTLCQNQTLHGLAHTTEVVAILWYFCLFWPKIGCHGNVPLSLVYGSVTDEFSDSTNPISKPNSAWTCCIKLRLWPFLWFFGLFWPKFGCHGNVP